MEVNNLEEARDWFLENSGGDLICVKGLESKSCSSYPEAKQFFERV